jgi:triphosphoribosyl-dephospho-CoA synthase
VSQQTNISIFCRHHATRLRVSARPLPYLIGLSAIQSLHQELAAYPKPGLVSPIDSGSHRDMDAALFFRSLFSLRSYFCEVATAGMLGVPFAVLKPIAIAAEARMLTATRGVNTHRGAIFNLGLLAAAAGSLLQSGETLKDDALGAEVRAAWGDEIREHGRSLRQVSHGRAVATRYGVGGALEGAAAGFPHVFKIGLPVLQDALARGGSPNAATVQCLFSLMAVLPDTNLLYRGGEAGLILAQDVAQQFLADGGVHREGWRKHAMSLHRLFVDRNLSPGGSADLLAATLFVNRLQHIFNTTSN